MLPKHVLPICYQTDLGQGLTAGDQPFFPTIFLSAIRHSLLFGRGKHLADGDMVLESTRKPASQSCEAVTDALWKRKVEFLLYLALL
jgi:hypothetical protein